MFTNSIDNKIQYTNNDNIELLDLTTSIFNDFKNPNSIFSFYKVGKDMEMRPDKVSLAAYGTTEYTEMILKYSDICNPFAIEYGDIIYVQSVNDIYNDVKDVILNSDKSKMVDRVKLYHKYIDNDKASEDSDNTQKISTGYTEANISKKNNNTGIIVSNGRIYFGDNVSVNAGNVEDISGDNLTTSDLVDCAKQGVTLGQFLDLAVKNQINK